MRMIIEAKEGLEDLLCYNDLMRKQQEDSQRQEEAWREDELIKKPQEEIEEQKKQAVMDACINKKQQIPDDKQAAKSAMEHAKEKEHLHTEQKYIESLSNS